MVREAASFSKVVLLLVMPTLGTCANGWNVRSAFGLTLFQNQRNGAPADATRRNPIADQSVAIQQARGRGQGRGQICIFYEKTFYSRCMGFAVAASRWESACRSA